MSLPAAALIVVLLIALLGTVGNSVKLYVLSDATDCIMEEVLVKYIEK